jgi:hypothetical protein
MADLVHPLALVDDDTTIRITMRETLEGAWLLL